MTPILAQIGKLRIVPVIALERVEDAAPLADALVAGGLPIAEITFRTAAAPESIKIMAQRGDVLVGAGTVLNVDTVKRAIDCGAKFIVSPGINPKVVSYCVANNIPITPGTATASDIEVALDLGLTTVKFFPAEAIGGIKLLKSLIAPYGMMNFMPTGGITPGNMTEYLKLSNVFACGGSWMVSKELLSAQAFDQVTELTKEAVRLALLARP